MGKCEKIQDRTLVLANGAVTLIQIFKVDDSRYPDGFSFTYRLMSAERKLLFAVENSHGRSHTHKGPRKEYSEFDWKQGLEMFSAEVREYKRRNNIS